LIFRPRSTIDQGNTCCYKTILIRSNIRFRVMNPWCQRHIYKYRSTWN